MKTEYKITNADAYAALKVLIAHVETEVKWGNVDEDEIGHLNNVIDALDNADKIIIVAKKGWVDE